MEREEQRVGRGRPHVATLSSAVRGSGVHSTTPPVLDVEKVCLRRAASRVTESVIRESAPPLRKSGETRAGEG